MSFGVNFMVKNSIDPVRVTPLHLWYHPGGTQSKVTGGVVVDSLLKLLVIRLRELVGIRNTFLPRNSAICNRSRQDLRFF